MVSIRATAAALVLLTFCLMLSDTSAQHSNVRNCCRSYIKVKLGFRLITGYSVQSDKEFCSISAIIFHTKKGRACTDPALDWVMEYVNRIRTEAQIVHKASLMTKHHSAK